MKAFNLGLILRDKKVLIPTLIFIGVIAVLLITLIVEEAAIPSSPLLPDIKVNQSVSESKVRNSEIEKIKPSLPYKDEENKILIQYFPKSKDVVVRILQASTIEEYRQKKKLAEAKLKEFGADNPCYLLVLWGGPLELKGKYNREDFRTTGCTNF